MFKRLKRNNGYIWMLAAIVIGSIAAWGTMTTIQHAQDRAPVVITTQPIKPYAAITDHLFMVKQVYAGAVPDNAFTSVSSLPPAYADRPIPAGAIVTKDMFRPTGGRLSAKEPLVEREDLRAMALPLSPEQGGTLPQAGDVVDVISIRELPDGTSDTYVVAETLQVIDGHDKTGEGPVIVLVPKDRVTAIGAAVFSGTIQIVLHGMEVQRGNDTAVMGTEAPSHAKRDE